METRAYNKIYLEIAMQNLARAFDYAVNDAKFTLDEFIDMFITTGIAKKFLDGNPYYVAGMSGIELVKKVYYEATGHTLDIEPKFRQHRTQEYWLGYVIAYYFWYTNKNISKVRYFISFNDLLKMYSTYHEMDLSYFVDALDKKLSNNNLGLKHYRESANYSQSELASLTGIPVRTIQQYEQGRKDISKANWEYIKKIEKVLKIDM